MTQSLCKAMLLCAGKGTRLGELSDECPKPLLPVCGIPILRFGISNLVARGVTDIVINLHHRGEMIREELGDGGDLGARIQYSVEEEILGTGGGLKKALALLDPEGRDEPFLSMNGKLIFDLDVEALLESFSSTESSLGTMVVKPTPDALQWGAVDVRPDGEDLRVHNILGEGSYMFCGAHVTRPSTVATLPDGEACMVRQGYLPWLQSGKRVTAFVHQGGYFAEHSTPKRYLQSSIDLLQGAHLSHPPAPLTGIDASAQIDPSSTIIEPVRIAPGAVVEANCQIGPNAVIGRMARVAAGSTIRDAVVWSGARAAGELDHAIVTPRTCIPADGADDID